jgi:hypothetical protein
MIDSNIRNSIIEDFKRGDSVCSLSKKYNRGKSTILYITKDHVCGVDHNSSEKRRERALISNEKISLDSEKREEISNKISEALKSYYKDNEHSITRETVVARQKIFTDLELSYKTFLESQYGTLSHQEISGRFFDFVNEKYVIETTEDYGKGVCSATKRFQEITNDKRIKIIFCKTEKVGEKRFNRLIDAGVEVHDISEIKNNSLNYPVEKVKDKKRKINIVHGTLNGYKHCRCEICKKVKRDYNKKTKELCRVRLNV